MRHTIKSQDMTRFKHTTLLLFALSMGAFNAAAQDESDDFDSDTTRVLLGNKVILIVNNDDSTIVDLDEVTQAQREEELKEEMTHWGGLDIGVNMLVNANGSSDWSGEEDWLNLNPGRSLQWGINFNETKIKLVDHYVGLTTGLGIAWSSYGLNQKYFLSNERPIIDTTTMEVSMSDELYAYEDTLNYTKNKFRVTTLRVPLFLEFNTSLQRERNFHLSAGVIGNWNFSNVYKRKYEVDGKRHKDRSKDDYFVEDFSLDAQVRVGFSGLTLYAQYGLTAFFEEGRGPEAYPVTFGINFPFD